MSISDSGWNRLLYVVAGLSLVAVAIFMIFVIPQVKNNPGTVLGALWVLAGIELFIAVILFGIGFMNKRDSRFTRILLVFVGLIAILWGL
jgi:hypothetical protein